VEDRVRVIPNGVDHGFWSQEARDGVRARFELPEEVPLVLFVGGLWPHKQVETLIDALPLLDGHHLAVAGPLRDRAAQVRAHAAKRGMAKRVHLLGKVDREDLRDLYHACAVHASASDNEGFGLTFLEAMATGAPVVARPVGVVPELVDAGASVHVARSPAGFAEAIETAEARGGKGNTEVAARYDWEQVVDRLVACYEEVAR
jgi:glycosyltransferase involved in cell wall biosynthesis